MKIHKDTLRNHLWLLLSTVFEASHATVCTMLLTPYQAQPFIHTHTSHFAFSTPLLLAESSCDRPTLRFSYRTFHTVQPAQSACPTLSCQGMLPLQQPAVNGKIGCSFHTCLQNASDDGNICYHAALAQHNPTVMLCNMKAEGTGLSWLLSSYKVRLSRA